ncbi:GAF domain-containing protein [Hyalangium versicolor]|uniref:GAF domain-containing protein n=1 Tax=Hyalangium versicolor TaxID=2861190 RepID=UPI001CC90E78|nr:GAF domain-containing protein [Hyalangium versicolor]
MAWGLIVEPNTACSSKYRALLAEAGLEPVAAQDGVAARAAFKLRDEAPALVLTELSLAGVDGFQLIRELRKHAPDVRVIVLSSFVKMRTAALERKEEFGINEVLAKAAPIESIRRALHRVLGRKLPEPPASSASAPPSPLPALPALPALDPPILRAPPRASASSTNPSLLTREQARLAKIASLRLVDDAPPDEQLQSLVQETARAFNVPIALLSLVLEDRQWFKAHVGIGGKVLQDRGTERDVALCAHVVEADQPEPLIVPDAATHPVFSTNRLVREGLFRSYAGAPLITREGTVLGTLCILDHKPLSISSEQVDALVALARRVAGDLELRSQLSKSQDALNASRGAHAADRLRADVLAATLNGLDDAVLLLDHKRTILFANEYMAAIADRTVSELIGMNREEFLRGFSERFADPPDFLRRMLILPEGPYVGREDFELRQPPGRMVRWTSRPVAFADGNFGQVSVYRDVTAEYAEELLLRDF